MRRDMDLVRHILMAIEGANDHAQEATNRLGASGDYTHEQIGYHVLLMAEGGLLQATDVTSMGDNIPQAVPTRMTWQGHEFLDAARSDTAWATAQRRGLAIGGLTLPVLLELLKDIALHELGLRQ